MRERREAQAKHEQALKDSALFPAKGKAEAEFTTVAGHTHRTILSPVTLASAMAQQPTTLLEIPVVDKRGRVSAAWFRAGALLSCVDLTGMSRFPR